MDIEKIVNALKRYYSVRSDTDLAKVFGYGPSAIGQWRKRGRVPLERILCILPPDVTIENVINGDLSVLVNTKTPPTQEAKKSTITKWVMSDNSMLPRIERGDVLFIDASLTTPEHGNIYLFQRGSFEKLVRKVKLVVRDGVPVVKMVAFDTCESEIEYDSSMSCLGQVVMVGIDLNRKY